ncbi:MAG: NAD-dependent dehydratase [Planctomycetes bacterium GWF2_41_51]|nr:MAG: NAD-dependent dehydratase [Planctomycetes bacterium GWF2_41_51]HBG27223.1 NAD-dependent dehydratase [Phycisphaerales bacterium]
MSDKSVLVTGADGFIGSHLTEILLEKGFKVRALSYYNSFNNWGWLEQIKSSVKLEIVSGDIRDPYFCIGLTKDIDIVFHLAALIAIPFSYKAPYSYVQTNVLGTTNLCQACMSNSVERLIQTSTSEVYGSALYVPIDEKHPLQPQSPYSASKIASDAIAMSFYNTFELPVTIARPFNTYGPRQSARAVIPAIISQLLTGREEIDLGDLETTRDFNFVKDICHGFIMLALSRDSIGQTYNIGSNTEVAIGEVFELLKEITGSDAKYVCDKLRIRPNKSEVRRLKCDNTKLASLTGYRPEFSMERGLRETVTWFSDPVNLSRYKTDTYNI